MLEALAAELVTFHMVDGRVVEINPAQVTQLVHPRNEEGNKVVHDKVNCVIKLTDGFASVIETCKEVSEALQARGKELGVE